MPSTNNLLTIEDLSDSESFTIKIDGVVYELLDPANFGIIEQARLERYRKRLNAIHGDEEPTEEEEQAAVEALDKLVKMVVPDMTDGVLGKIPPVHKTAIVEAFTYAVWSRGADMKEKVAAANKETVATPQKRTPRRPKK